MKHANGWGKDHYLTDDVKARLLEAFQVGAVLADAAAYAGIGTRTLHRWFQLGRDPEGPEEFRQLVAEAERARGHGNVVSLGVLATSEDWRAHRARLGMQRREYAERRFVNGEVNHKHQHQIDLTALSQEDLETLRAIVAKAAPEGVLELEPVAEVDEGLSG